jgi:predicted DNA-binding transcriptional regulator AlpA
MTPRKSILRMPALKAKVQMSETQIGDAVKRGEFPKPFKILPHGRAIAWDESEVDAFIVERLAARE